MAKLRLEIERRRLNLSQARLAKLLGTQQPQISNVETGRLKPWETWRERLEKTFGLTLEELLEEVGEDG